MPRLVTFLIVFVVSCELPQPVSLDESKLISEIDPACSLPLDKRNIFDTLEVKGRFYGFCSTECKKAFCEGKTLIPCPLPGS